MSTSRFYDGQTGVSRSVGIFPFGREVRVVADDDSTLAVWRIDQIRAAPERDPDGAVTLTARGLPGVVLVDDPVTLDALHRLGVRFPHDKALSGRHWIAVSAALIASLAAGAIVVTAVPGWLASRIPVSWERQLGAPAEAVITASYRRCTGAAGEAALNRLVGRLLIAGDVEMPVSVTVLDASLMNAFTLPGGHVLLMRGLIERVDDGAELAGVIAHELGHVAHRDSATLLLRGMLFSMLTHLLGLGDTGGFAANSASQLTSLAYTRAAEAAADDTAIDLLSKAGIRADGLSRFFALIDHDLGAEPGRDGYTNSSHSTLNWLSTHPPSAERREKTARPASGDAPFTDAEWTAIRSMCARN